MHNGDPPPKGRPPPAGRPGAGGAFAAALPGALVPELLWAHYTEGLVLLGGGPWNLEWDMRIWGKG